MMCFVPTKFIPIPPPFCLSAAGFGKIFGPTTLVMFLHRLVFPDLVTKYLLPCYDVAYRLVQSS